MTVVMLTSLLFTLQALSPLAPIAIMTFSLACYPLPIQTMGVVTRMAPTPEDTTAQPVHRMTTATVSPSLVTYCPRYLLCHPYHDCQPCPSRRYQHCDDLLPIVVIAALSARKHHHQQYHQYHHNQQAVVAIGTSSLP